MTAPSDDREWEEPAAAAPGRRVLESLELRQRLTTSQAAARTQMVRRLRVILPAVAVVLVALFLLNTRSDGVDDAFLKDFANLDATPQELRMANPRVTGIDNEGQPYEITARSAIRDPASEEIVELDGPRAVSRRTDERTVAYAEKGLFQTAAKILDLKQGVTVEHSIGRDTYVLKTPAARVSIDDETVETQDGVEGVSETGVLRADRMRAYNTEGRIVFEGNVSMRIFPRNADTRPPGAQGG